ncbi:hypothetical protein [Intrasporangium mesophilum]
MCDLLEGRGWVQREWLIREAGKVIPPGQAIRQAERDRRKAAGRDRPKPPSERAIARSEDRLIQAGRRTLVVARLRLRYGSAFIERMTDAEGVEWVRMLSLPESVVQERERLRASINSTVNPEEGTAWPNA